MVFSIDIFTFSILIAEKPITTRLSSTFQTCIELLYKQIIAKYIESKFILQTPYKTTIVTFPLTTQVAILLYTANGMVHFLWARGNDPDNSSIPYLTAIGDLLGTSLLALTFFFLSLIPKK